MMIPVVPSAVYESSFSFTSLSAFVAVYFLDNCHADWGEMKSQRSFDLHFLYD
jgi:hypothetical protein